MDNDLKAALNRALRDGVKQKKIAEDIGAGAAQQLQNFRRTGHLGAELRQKLAAVLVKRGYLDAEFAAEHRGPDRVDRQIVRESMAAYSIAEKATPSNLLYYGGPPLDKDLVQKALGWANAINGDDGYQYARIIAALAAEVQSAHRELEDIRTRFLELYKEMKIEARARGLKVD